MGAAILNICSLCTRKPPLLSAPLASDLLYFQRVTGVLCGGWCPVVRFVLVFVGRSRCHQIVCSLRVCRLLHFRALPLPRSLFSLGNVCGVFSVVCGVIGRLFCCGVTYCDFAHHDSIEVDSGGVVVCLPELSWDDKISSRLNSSLLVHEFL